jgi:hypothetical protein
MYSFDDRWVHELWAFMEWQNRANPKDSKKKLSQCYFVNHKFHVEWPETEPGLRATEAEANCPSHGTDTPYV